MSYPDQNIPENRIETLEKQVGWAFQMFTRIRREIGFSSDLAMHKRTLILIDKLCEEGQMLMGHARSPNAEGLKDE